MPAFSINNSNQTYDEEVYHITTNESNISEVNDDIS